MTVGFGAETLAVGGPAAVAPQSCHRLWPRCCRVVGLACVLQDGRFRRLAAEL